MYMYMHMYMHMYMYMYYVWVCIDGQIHGWKDGWMDGRTDGWMDRVAHAVSSKWILQGLMISRASTKALIGFRKEKPYSLE